MAHNGILLHFIISSVCLFVFNRKVAISFSMKCFSDRWYDYTRLCKEGSGGQILVIRWIGQSPGHWARDLPPIRMRHNGRCTAVSDQSHRFGPDYFSCWFDLRTLQTKNKAGQNAIQWCWRQGGVQQEWSRRRCERRPHHLLVVRGQGWIPQGSFDLVVVVFFANTYLFSCCSLFVSMD